MNKNHRTATERALHGRGHEFVAYDADGNVVASQFVMPGRSLEAFAAEFPGNDVAEVRGSREVRTITAA